MNQLSSQTLHAIEVLNRCHSMCLSMAMTQGLESVDSRPQHLRLLIDCADICALTADFMSHKSQFHTRLCALCAEICDVCGQTCAAAGGMDDCAALCLSCSEVCTRMARPEHAEILEIASSLPPI